MAFKIGSSTVVDNQTQYLSAGGSGAIIRVFPAKGSISAGDPLILNYTGTVSKYPLANTMNWENSYYGKTEIIAQQLAVGDYYHSSIDNNGRMYIAYRTSGNAPGLLTVYNSANAIISSSQNANLSSDGTGAQWIYLASVSPYNNDLLILTANSSYKPIRVATYNYGSSTLTVRSNTYNYMNGYTSPLQASAQVVYNNNIFRLKSANQTSSSDDYPYISSNDALQLSTGSAAFIFHSDSTGLGVAASYSSEGSSNSLSQGTQRFVGSEGGLGTGNSRRLVGAYQSSNNKVVTIWKIDSNTYRYINFKANTYAVEESTIVSNGVLMTTSGGSDVIVEGGRLGPFFDAATEKAVFAYWDSGNSSARLSFIPHSGGSASAGSNFASLSTAISHATSYGESPYYGDMNMAMTRDHNGYFHIAYVPRSVNSSGAQLGIYVGIFKMDFSTNTPTNLMTGTRLAQYGNTFIYNIHLDNKSGKGTVIYKNLENGYLTAISYLYNKPSTMFMGLAANSASDGANVEVVMPGSFISYTGAAAGVDYYIRAADGKLLTANVGPKVATGIANNTIFVLPREEL